MPKLLKEVCYGAQRHSVALAYIGKRCEVQCRQTTWDVKNWLSTDSVNEWLVCVGDADVEVEKQNEKRHVDDVARYVVT